MNESNLYEYQMLREEMMENLKTQNSLSVSTIGIAITVLTLTSGLDFSNPYLNLLPLMILLPSALKTHMLKHDTSVISSYLSVRYENMKGIYWETAYNHYRLKHHAKRSKVIIFLRNCEYGMVGLICIAFYVYGVFNQISRDCTDSRLSAPIVEIIVGIASVLVVIWIFFITFDYHSMNAREIEADNKDWFDILTKD